MSSAAIRKLRRVAFIALGLYVAAAAALALWGCLDHLEPADAIVVPGNTVAPDGTPSPRLRARLNAALQAYWQGAAPLIVVSGGVGIEGFDEAAVMAAYLVQQGVPASAVLRDSAGNDTAATAANTAHLLQARGLTSVIVATQYFHVPRTCLALRHAGLRVSGSVHARYVEARDLYSLAREVIGIAAYAVGLRG